MMNIKLVKKSLTFTMGCILSLNTLGLIPSVKAVEFTSPDAEPPARRVGGGVRGNFESAQSCVTDTQKELTALLPKAEVSLTTQGYPMFFWYVPPTSPAMIEFDLIDDTNGDIIYQSKIKTDGEVGIISLSLPENTSLPPLEIGKDYYWSFTILCDRLNWQVNPSVEGLIRRVEPSANLVQALSQASGMERVRLYANSGIWHDTIAELATLRRSNPNDAQLMAEWEELLRSVELDALIEEPLNHINIVSEQNSAPLMIEDN
jgi:hypothetical protein